MGEMQWKTVSERVFVLVTDRGLKIPASESLFLMNFKFFKRYLKFFLIYLVLTASVLKIECNNIKSK